MKRFYLPFLFIILFLSGCSNSTATVSKQKDNFDLQTKCTEQSKIYFNNYEKDPSQFTNSYESHYNNKLNKCFVLIYATALKDDTLFIDLYDALEGKHYAMYLGHKNCDTTILSLTNNLKKCQMDGGSIWLGGNDLGTPDIQLGFEGIANGTGIGNENTQKEFMTNIQPFMDD